MISATDKTDVPENNPSQVPISVINLLAGYTGTSWMFVSVLLAENFNSRNGEYFKSSKTEESTVSSEQV